MKLSRATVQRGGPVNVRRKNGDVGLPVCGQHFQHRVIGPTSFVGQCPDWRLSILAGGLRPVWMSPALSSGRDGSYRMGPIGMGSVTSAGLAGQCPIWRFSVLVGGHCPEWRIPKSAERSPAMRCARSPAMRCASESEKGVCAALFCFQFWPGAEGLGRV